MVKGNEAGLGLGFVSCLCLGGLTQGEEIPLLIKRTAWNGGAITREVKVI